MSSLGPLGKGAQGYGGGSGNSYYASDHPEPEENMDLFGQQSRRRFRRTSSIADVLRSRITDNRDITDIEEHWENNIDTAEEEMTAEEIINLNHLEFTEEEENPPLALNHYLKHITVFCIIIVVLSICTFFILSYINGF